MDSLSNGLATRLISYGVKRGDLVGLYMEKSIEMFLSILATLKAGAGYVPLDPEHPAERVQAIIDLAETKIVLTNKELQNQFVSVIPGDRVFSLTVNLGDLSPDSKPDVGLVTRDDISHVLFTSGSTGTPKGRAISYPNDIETID
jgi:non-ribosomal peptide synthetase component F